MTQNSWFFKRYLCFNSSHPKSANTNHNYWSQSWNMTGDLYSNTNYKISFLVFPPQIKACHSLTYFHSRNKDRVKWHKLILFYWKSWIYKYSIIIFSFNIFIVYIDYSHQYSMILNNILVPTINVRFGLIDLFLLLGMIVTLFFTLWWGNECLHLFEGSCDLLCCRIYLFCLLFHFVEDQPFGFVSTSSLTEIEK